MKNYRAGREVIKMDELSFILIEAGFQAVTMYVFIWTSLGILPTIISFNIFLHDVFKCQNVLN